MKIWTTDLTLSEINVLIKFNLEITLINYASKFLSPKKEKIKLITLAETVFFGSKTGNVSL